MMLGEKGLPHSGNVGNELYDKLGSLGLTSFMQEVTRVRALEGELARTIQMMRGVKAARVHIVLGDEGSFRRERQPPSASVIIRTDGADDARDGPGDPPSRRRRRARHEGRGGDGAQRRRAVARERLRLARRGARQPARAARRASRATSARQITRTLAPYLSPRNFQVSVAARLNADKTQTNETVYDPESRRRAQRARRSRRSRTRRTAPAPRRPAFRPTCPNSRAAAATPNNRTTPPTRRRN